jgi:5'-3' exonuclease
MRAAGIEPVVVFDGKPPASKSAVTEQRRAERTVATKAINGLKEKIAEAVTEGEREELQIRVTELQRKTPQVSREDRNDVKKFLYAAGVQFVTALGEADDLLASLCSRGDIDAVLSTDMDMLARRVPRLIIPETDDARILSEIRQEDVLRGLGLTYDQFVHACVLMGSDYSERSMTPPRAVDAARGGATTTASALLRGDGVTWETLLSERQREKWALGAPSREPDALAAMATTLGWPAPWISNLNA